MSTFFLSHSSSDRGFAERISSWLTAEGFTSFFLDFDPIHGIPGGRQWERELYVQLRAADAVIFIGSSASISSNWCFAELALARSIGTPIFPLLIEGESLHPLLRDTQWIEVKSDVEGGLRRLRLSLGRYGLDPSDSFAWDPARPPYPGLVSFEAEDAAVFFGRDDKIGELMSRLHPTLERGARRFVPVIGPSGTGKSSLVRAGLIPRLQKRGWTIVRPFRPGDRPVTALARALASTTTQRDAPRRERADLESQIRRNPRLVVELARDLTGDTSAPVLLVIDQAEELVAPNIRQETEDFVELLSQAIDEPTPLWAVATVRSGSFPSFFDEPFTAKLLNDAVVVQPLERSRLAQVIELPARQAGVELEEGLVHRMVEDARTGDALPLLGYTLRQLWERSRHRNLRVTHADYDAIGGVIGALAQHADAVVELLAQRGQEGPVIPTLLKLATLDVAYEPSRRRVRRQDLEHGENEAIDALVEARLVTISSENDVSLVEVAHEALFRAWPPLRNAIEESRDELRARAEIEQAARAWELAGRRDSYLLRADRLETALRYVEAAPVEDRDLVGIREYIERSAAEEQGARGAASVRNLCGFEIL